MLKYSILDVNAQRPAETEWCKKEDRLNLQFTGIIVYL